MPSSLDIDEYHRQLGRIMSDFALAEALLRSLLAGLTGLDDVGYRTLLSGTRAHQACTLIRRHYTAKQEAIPAELDEAIKRFSEINNERNNIIHYGISDRDGEHKWTNALTVADIRNAMKRTVTNKLMQDIEIDLTYIILTFFAFNPGMPNETREAFKSVTASHSWRYIPPKQGGKGR